MKALSSFFTVFIAVILFTGCREQRVKISGCKGKLKILTENYNKDSVFFYAPNAFTPNGDGLNETFHFNYSGVKSIQFSVFKGRKLIYMNEHIIDGWNGFDGNERRPGNYTYKGSFVTRHNETVEFEGEVSSFPEDIAKSGVANCEDCVFGDMIDVWTGEINSTSDVFTCN